MHTAVTNLAKSTLDHTKKLIKAMDAEWFSYNRHDLVNQLGHLKQLHDQKATKQVVEKIEHIMVHIEKIEHEFHEWLNASVRQNHENAVGSDLDGLLQLVTTPKTYPKRKKILSDLFHRWEIILFVVLFLVGIDLIVLGWTSFMRYSMIWLCLWSFVWFVVTRFFVVR
jgi:hypothetical protein